MGDARFRRKQEAKYRSIAGQRKVDPWIGHKVGLELREVHVESPVKAKRGLSRREYEADGLRRLGNGTVMEEMTWAMMRLRFV